MQNHQTLINKDNNGVIAAIVVLMYGATDHKISIEKNLDDFTVKKYVTFKMPIGVKHALIEQVDVEPNNGMTLYTQDCIIGNDGVFMFTPSCIKIFSAKKLRAICKFSMIDNEGFILIPDYLTNGFVTTLKIDDL